MIPEQSTPCYDISFLIGHFWKFLSLVLNICCSVLYRNFFSSHVCLNQYKYMLKCTAIQ